MRGKGRKCESLDRIVLTARLRAAWDAYVQAKHQTELDPPSLMSTTSEWGRYSQLRAGAEVRVQHAVNNLLGEVAAAADCDDDARQWKDEQAAKRRKRSQAPR